MLPADGLIGRTSPGHRCYPRSKLQAEPRSVRLCCPIRAAAESSCDLHPGNFIGQYGDVLHHPGAASPAVRGRHGNFHIAAAFQSKPALRSRAGQPTALHSNIPNGSPAAALRLAFHQRPALPLDISAVLAGIPQRILHRHRQGGDNVRRNFQIQRQWQTCPPAPPRRRFAP